MGGEERVPLIQGGGVGYQQTSNANAPQHVPPQALGKNGLYVSTAQGSFPVAGSPGVLAVPQGQAIIAPSSPYGTHTTTVTQVADVPKDETHPRTTAVKVLILYILGIFIYPCQIASIVLSLRMCKKGYIRARKTEVTVFCIIEIIGLACIPGFGWYVDSNCDYDYCMPIWWGFFAFLSYFLIALAFGIPRVLFIWKYDGEKDSTTAFVPMSNPPLAPSSHGVNPQFANIPGKENPRTLAVVSLIMYLVGIFVPPCQIPSVVLSLHMCRKGYIRTKRSVVIAMCVMELIGLAFIPAFSWYREIQCDNYYRYCYYAWIGWISFLIFFVFEIAFGIPRILFTWRHCSDQESTFASTPMSNPVTFAAGYHQL